MYKKKKGKKKNKIKVVKSSKKCCGLSNEEMFNLCSNFKIRDSKILILNTFYNISLRIESAYMLFFVMALPWCEKSKQTDL